jgi:hypothetical protein
MFQAITQLLKFNQAATKRSSQWRIHNKRGQVLPFALPSFSKKKIRTTSMLV